MYIFIQENVFEYVVSKVVAISSRPQCDKPYTWFSIALVWLAWHFFECRCDLLVRIHHIDLNDTGLIPVTIQGIAKRTQYPMEFVTVILYV